MLLEGPSKSKREEKVIFSSKTTIAVETLHMMAGVSDGHIQAWDIPKFEELAA